LPLPLAPTMATNCPTGISSEIPRRISTRRAPFWIHFFAPLTWINEPSTPNGSVNRQPSTALRAPPAVEHSYTVVVDVWRRLFVVGWLLLVASLHAADRPTIVCFGDSITAGYGLADGEAYSDLLQKKLDAQGYLYKVINQGTSGATTKDALGALPSVLRMHAAVVIVEFGGNDGLRGLPVEQSRNNLDQILTGLEKAHVKILLAGITLPPDYGPDYIRSFDQIFRDLAAKHHVAFIPMLYKNLIHVPGTIQNDGIHPTAKGSAIIADTLLPVLKPLLRRRL
jgi:acyl-CoA thioesterase I